MFEGIDAEALGEEGSPGNSSTAGTSGGEEVCAGGIGGIGGMGDIDGRPGITGGAGGTRGIGKPRPEEGDDPRGLSVVAASVCPNENPDLDDEGVVESFPVWPPDGPPKLNEPLPSGRLPGGVENENPCSTGGRPSDGKPAKPASGGNPPCPGIPNMPGGTGGIGG